MRRSTRAARLRIRLRSVGGSCRWTAPRGARRKALVTGVASAPRGAPRPAPPAGYAPANGARCAAAFRPAYQSRSTLNSPPLRRRVLSLDSPTWCSAQSACHGSRLRATRGAPSGATRGLRSGEWSQVRRRIQTRVPEPLDSEFASAPSAGPVAGQPHVVLGAKRLSRESPPRHAGRPVQRHPRATLRRMEPGAPPHSDPRTRAARLRIRLCSVDGSCRWTAPHGTGRGCNGLAPVPHL